MDRSEDDKPFDGLIEDFKMDSFKDNPEGDWPEDYEHRNGFYMCRCYRCKEHFTGYKRRIVCKKCHIETTGIQLELPI